MVSPRTSIAPAIKLQLVYAIDEAARGFYWPESEQKRLELMSVARGSPMIFESTYQGRPGRREGSIFLSADLDNFFHPPLGINGESCLSLGIQSPDTAAFLASAHGVFQAWDTAFSSSSQAAHTACITGLFVPCSSYHCGEDESIFGPCDFHFDILILDVFRERVDWGGLVSALKTQFHKWRPSEIIIEKKASGISLIQSMKNSGLPIIEAKADESKGARATNSIGVKSAGSVQGWFRQHRVMVPADVSCAWLDGWRAEMKDFSGDDDASSDRVDATVHLIQRAIFLGSASAVLPQDWAPEKSGTPARLSESQAAALLLDNPDPRAQTLAAIAMLPSWANDETWGLCGSCYNYTDGFCKIHQRRVLSLDSCDSYLNVSDAAADADLIQSRNAYTGAAGIPAALSRVLG